ncbi:MAG: bifunctional hydroxymethylpyrimidine kinase/phosphomethylpyrimidine kinase [Gemmatimonadales bacterium]
MSHARYDVPVALTIAGSDSGGGAGIQADLRTFQELGVFGTSVVTAVTAQNSVVVRAWEPMSAALVAQQLDAALEDLAPRAVKTGMLGTADVVEVVARGLARHRLPNYVLDPVIVSTSGTRLLNPDAERLLVTRLLPLADLVTPNLDEAEALTATTVRTPEEMETAGRALIRAGAKSALVKGGHLDRELLVDVLVMPTGVRRFEHRKIAGPPVHGTGCVLSAAIAAGLAKDIGLEQAVEHAVELVQRRIATARG